MRTTSDNIKTLEELYNSQGFASFRDSIYGNDGFINDPDRAERIAEAAEHGCDGSTHQEVLGDWRDYLNTLKVFDPDYDDPEDRDDFDLDEETYEKILAEINACEDWHEKNSSLHNQRF